MILGRTRRTVGTGGQTRPHRTWCGSTPLVYLQVGGGGRRCVEPKCRGVTLPTTSFHHPGGTNGGETGSGLAAAHVRGGIAAGGLPGVDETGPATRPGPAMGALPSIVVVDDRPARPFVKGMFQVSAHVPADQRST